MATVRTLSLKGKSVNVPHLEHRGGKNVTTFDKETGEAVVDEFTAKALLEFYPKDIELVKGSPSDEYNSPTVAVDVAAQRADVADDSE